MMEFLWDFELLVTRLYGWRESIEEDSYTGDYEVLKMKTLHVRTNI